ncbi:hypothetical protein CHLNCDRAFT_56389 [Chlorella variabilis]|uniref:Uncharacterized protein n=1 Tax=Chlorella variabilis TaxID=554065 RepID=E1ZRQ8_CHLVA|nr:hypothetical protein CHLNCDRAFT_56389 [Chlorella variabilis]EFN51454.1 hypothetical protein CHLNCDRAFT_56389 [Chlorella variabilis]|eukprot:XP_005843556.1 hypothetical protein CHLNCDRAFT_56389 [Chlorella variabilis]
MRPAFNQDCSCLAVGTSRGFAVYNTEPFREQFRRDFDDGGIAIVEMLFRCNIFCLVGGGAVPKYPPTKAIIYDDHQGRPIGELSFRTNGVPVKLPKDPIPFPTLSSCLGYNFSKLRLLHPIKTLNNPRGLVALSPNAQPTVLGCPGLHPRQVRVELYDTRRTKFVTAHNSCLAALALSSNGKLLATASDKGTLVRIFSTGDGAKLRELRRGSDPAKIYSLAFSHGDMPNWVAVTSDKGTAHIFSLSGRRQQAGGSRDATTGVQSYLPVGASYFASERSFAQLRLPDAHHALVGFGKDPTTVLVVSATGGIYKGSFDPEQGGSCDVQSFVQFEES